MKNILLLVFIIFFIFSKQQNIKFSKKININSFFTIRFDHNEKDYFLQYDTNLITNVYFYNGNRRREKSALFFKGIKEGEATILLKNKFISNFYVIKIVDKKKIISKQNKTKQSNKDYTSFYNGEKFFKEKKYNNALPLLLSFYENNKDGLSEKKESCLFFMGNIFLNYPNFSPSKAKEYFTILVKEYPQGFYFHKARKKIDYINYKFY